ncbi:MAG TPA: TolC family protein, partial [Polyangiaceae bacterium]|nr:TolC family protein [Polyangiaceae bacterium]
MLKTLLRRTVRTAALSVALVLFASGVRAESLPPPALPSKITLADALELLRNRSPRTRAEQARLEVASAARLEASVYPNPSLSYGALLLARGANTGARRQHEIVVEQPLLLFGQRGARGRVAELSIRAERARIAASLA